MSSGWPAAFVLARRRAGCFVTCVSGFCWVRECVSVFRGLEWPYVGIRDYLSSSLKELLGMSKRVLQEVIEAQESGQRRE